MTHVTRRQWVAFTVSLACALAIATWSGLDGLRTSDRTPVRPVVEASPGQQVDLAGVLVTVARVEVADSLPNADPDDDPVVARAGATLVKVSYTVVNKDKIEDVFCAGEAVQYPGAATQRTWEDDYSLEADVFDSESVGCQPPAGEPADTPVESVDVYEVPADAVDGLVVRVGRTEGTWIQVAV